VIFKKGLDFDHLHSRALRTVFDENCAWLNGDLPVHKHLDLIKVRNRSALGHLPPTADRRPPINRTLS
jgi:hypothetical protein